MMDVWSFSHCVWSTEDWNALTISAARGEARRSVRCRMMVGAAMDGTAGGSS